MNILFLIKQSFPFGAAYSLRTRAFLEIMTALGHTATVVCSGGGETESEVAYLRAHPNVTRVIVPEKHGIAQALAESYEYGKEVDKILDANKIDLILSASMHDKIGLILKSSKRTNTPIIIESCEWYHHSSWKNGRLDPRFWAFEYAWSHWFPKADGYIAISKLLASHYAETGKPVVRIPTILDAKETRPQLTPPNTDGRINLLFAGRFGGTKDDVTPIACAVDSDDDLKRQFRLNIVGPSRDEVLAHEAMRVHVDSLERAGALRITGRIPQERIADEYRAADFGCFIRPNRRSSNAGFSTKLGEGMAAGTPFIVNDTGDIADYIENGVAGYVFKKAAPEEIAELLRDIASQSQNERARMRAKARSTAERCFDWRPYVDTFSQLIENVKESYLD